MIQNIAKTKIIFFDIDGTLVSFKTHTIPQSTLDAIHSVREKGVKITMLRHVGIGVAMGNASDEVKAAADIVTTSVDDDGVANIINNTFFRLMRQGTEVWD